MSTMIETGYAEVKHSWLKTIAIWTILISLILLVASALVESRGRQKRLGAKKIIEQEKQRAKNLENFWYAEMHNLFSVQLGDGKIIYPEIRKRFSETLWLIKERTGRPLSFQTSVYYNRYDRYTEVSTRVNSTNSQAIIDLHVQASKDVFDRLKSQGDPNFRDTFKAHLVIVLMHELEHLRTDKTVYGKNDLAEESRAWADTCKYIIDPMVRVHGVEIATDFTCYNAWIKSNGDTNHPAWKSTVQQNIHSTYNTKNPGAK